jgi:hypothetical protein
VGVAENAVTGDTHQSRVLRSTGNKKRTSLRIFWLSRPGLEDPFSEFSAFRLPHQPDSAGRGFETEEVK